MSTEDELSSEGSTPPTPSSADLPDSPDIDTVTSFDSDDSNLRDTHSVSGRDSSNYETGTRSTPSHTSSGRSSGIVKSVMLQLTLILTCLGNFVNAFVSWVMYKINGKKSNKQQDFNKARGRFEKKDECEEEIPTRKVRPSVGPAGRVDELREVYNPNETMIGKILYTIRKKTRDLLLILKPELLRIARLFPKNVQSFLGVLKKTDNDKKVYLPTPETNLKRAKEGENKTPFTQYRTSTQFSIHR